MAALALAHQALSVELLLSARWLAATALRWSKVYRSFAALMRLFRIRVLHLIFHKQYRFSQSSAWRKKPLLLHQINTTGLR
jgi:hypothetical protein